MIPPSPAMAMGSCWKFRVSSCSSFNGYGRSFLKKIMRWWNHVTWMGRAIWMLSEFPYNLSRKKSNKFFFLMCSELIFTSIFMFKQIVESHAVNLWAIDWLFVLWCDSSCVWWVEISWNINCIVFRAWWCFRQ